MNRENERESQKGKRHITPLTVSLIAIAVIMVAAACIVVSICRKDEPKITNTFIDSKLDTEPIFTIIFLVLGIASGFNSVYRYLRKYTKGK